MPVQSGVRSLCLSAIFHRNASASHSHLICHAITFQSDNPKLGISFGRCVGRSVGRLVGWSGPWHSCQHSSPLNRLLKPIKMIKSILHVKFPLNLFNWNNAVDCHAEPMCLSGCVWNTLILFAKSCSLTSTSTVWKPFDRPIIVELDVDWLGPIIDQNHLHLTVHVTSSRQSTERHKNKQNKKNEKLEKWKNYSQNSKSTKPKKPKRNDILVQ